MVLSGRQALMGAGDSTNPQADVAAKQAKRRRQKTQVEREKRGRSMPTTPDGSHASSSTSQSASEGQRTLREWRLFRGMTQQQLAVAAGLSITTVTGIERGRHEPSLHTARKLLRALDITLEQVAWPDL